VVARSRRIGWTSSFTYSKKDEVFAITLGNGDVACTLSILLPSFEAINSNPNITAVTNIEDTLYSYTDDNHSL
jgi:hypothetical protein